MTTATAGEDAKAAAGVAAAAAEATVTEEETNPFLMQDDLPKFASVEPKHLTPAIETLLEKMKIDFTALEEKLAVTTRTTSAAAEDQQEEQKTTQQEDLDLDFDDVLPEVERIQFALDYAWGIAGHLNGVKNGDELREAYQANQPKIVKAMSTFSQSKPLYDALKVVETKLDAGAGAGADSQATSTTQDDDDEFEAQQRRRAVEASLRSMKLGGVGLQGEAKDRFNEIKTRLAALATSFSNNVLDETKAFSLTIDDAAQVQGVPGSAKAMWASAHIAHVKAKKEKDEKSSDDDTSAAAATTIIPELDAEKGPWRITLDGPSYIATLSHVRDRFIREKVYKASITKASEKSKEKNNVPLIYEILKLKKERAKLLDFNNHAELSLASKMAPSVEAVAALTNLIADKALPAAQRELVEITDFARKKGGDEYSADKIEKLAPWDITFWSERLKETKFDLTEEETRPYFALPAVLDGMWTLVRRIFNINVTAADGQAEVWNKDVFFFHVKDKETGKHMASFYLDPYSRPEDKRGGAWMGTCIGKSKAVKRDVPVAYLTCNGSPPVGDAPSLMTFREVETLFHEFGHGLQHMLTKATVGDVAGINGVEWDAVELPSQFMENFCYDRPTIYGFAKHWKTGEAMPEAMFKKLCDQKTYNAGMQTCRQLLFGQLDMALHSTFDPEAGESGKGESIFDVHRRMATKYTPYSMPLPEDRFLCSFSHIFAGGYSAGYYSYKWAEVMSADAFSAFEEVGLENEEEIQKIGMKFRNTVLSLGGGVAPMEVFKQFRGREPNPDALLRHNGLA